MLKDSDMVGFAGTAGTVGMQKIYSDHQLRDAQGCTKKPTFFLFLWVFLFFYFLCEFFVSICLLLLLLFSLELV